ncbi:uncharacterized protein rab11fip5a isoform X2 [Synchiropus splendidus]|uniref:uncharacterized protein rab11fip5a isoform X2 n=1 Tax=Synchiropus splendidus TaxID=270530 RepID=UPI00237DD1A8|nr:uncharacterized protein rab11fip5a isoform X2 [Synchiropus splendidus]
MSSLNEEPKWVPTHVQVTVLRGRGLRGKGKHGTSDVYTIIQLGKEKYSTCVVEKTTEPEWREECSFELQPGALEKSSGRSGPAAGGCQLILTVMHRAVMGLDVFLGQALIQLEKIFHDTRCVKNEWYRLNSKTGKKEKERGDIQVTVQFTRNNLTASMYDLVMKDKSGSTFGKLKERIKGKKRSSEEDSSSAILPGGYGSLYRMRQRLPSDGGGEEDYEDDEGGEARRSKMRTFFLRGKLRKSSDTRSSTSLGSESSESSSRGGSLSPTAGISVVVSDLSNSPSNSSNLTADNSPEHVGDPSSLHCEFGDDTSEITIAVPELPPCVNGSHVDSVQPVDPGAGVRQGSLGLGLLQKSLPISTSLQNLSPRSLTDLPKGAAGDGRRWSFDRPGDEEKAAIAAALGRREEDASSRQIPLLRIPSYSSVKEAESQEKEQSNPTEVKHRGWFGSKDSKPSARPPITQLFPQASNTNPSLIPDSSSIQPIPGCDVEGDEASNASPKEEKPLSNLSDLFVKEQDLDESFDTFAAGRLYSPQQTRLDCQEKTADILAKVEPVTDQKMNPFLSTLPDSSVGAHKGSNLPQLDLCSFGLDTIPEDESFENNNEMPNSPEELIPKSSTNTSTNTNKLSSRSPDPSSSGLGSSSEEDFLSCNSSYSASDKVSACSSDEGLDFSSGSAPESAVIRPINKSELEEETSDRSHEWSSSDGLQSTVIHSPANDEKAVVEPTQESISSQPAVIPEGDNTEVGHSVSISSVDSPDPLPELPVSSEPHTLQESIILPRFDNAEEEKRTPPQRQGSPGPALDSDLFSNHPSFITTSSPDAKHQDSPLESTALESSSNPPVMFLEFPTVPGPDLDTSLLHTQTSEHSSALQSLYISTDSQNFHSCHSNPFTSSFDGPEGLNSANSTLCGELSQMVDGTDFGQSSTASEIIHPSESPAVSVNQDEASQISLENVPQEPSSSWNPFAGMLSESFDKPSVILDMNIWGTPSEEKQQPEDFEITLDSKETSVEITNDSATQDPTPDFSSFGDTLTQSVDEKPLGVQNKDLPAEPSVEMQQSESMDQTETPEPSLKITDDLFSQEPPATSYTLDTSLAKSVEDIFDDELRAAAAGDNQESESLDIDVVQAETSPKPTDTNDLLPQEPAASLNTSVGQTLTESVAEKPWVVDTEDPWGRSDGEIQLSENFGMALDRKEKSGPSLFEATSDLGPDKSSNLADSFTEPFKEPWSVFDNDPWRSPNEGSDSFGIATEQRNASYFTAAGLFPQEPAASTKSSADLFATSAIENPWGIQDDDPWSVLDNAAVEPKETPQSFIMLNDIIPLDVSTTTSVGGAGSESALDDPWGIQDGDPWSVPAGEIQRSVSFGFSTDASLTSWPSVMHTKDFSATSTNLNDWTESVESPWGVRDDTQTGKARHRSQSVGTLPASLHKEVAPFFEFDSVMLQDPSSSQPDLPSLTSFAPSFIPENGSFSLPSNSNTSARSPPDIVGPPVPALAIAQEVEQQQQEANQRTSPHPVKPLTSATLGEEKRGEGRSVLEKLKSTISPGKNSHLSELEPERRKSLTGGAGSYYHLTHSELVALLVQREAELEKQKKEFQQQKTLLAKREVELKRLKPQVRDLEDYIDTLLVRIMEQKPTLLQVRTKLK